DRPGGIAAGGANFAGGRGACQSGDGAISSRNFPNGAESRDRAPSARRGCGMARKRKESGLDVIASLPWPAGIIIGLLAFWGIRYGIDAYFSSAGGPLMSGLGEQASGGMFAPLAWLALA